MLLCCQLFLKICETHGEKKSKAHDFGVAGLQYVPSVFPEGFPRLEQRARGRLLWWLLEETGFACSHPNVQVPMDHTAQQVFAVIPDLIPVQLHELLPGLLLQFWKLRKCCNT